TVPSERLEHHFIEVAGKVAAHGQGSGAAPGYWVEVEEAEIQQIEADDPRDHTPQATPQVDMEGDQVADRNFLDGARQLEVGLQPNERELVGGHVQVVNPHAAPEEQQRPLQCMPDETRAVLPARGPRCSRVRDRDTHDEEETWEDRVRERPAIPRGVCK